MDTGTGFKKWRRHRFARYTLLGGGSLLFTLFFTWLLTEKIGLFYLWSYVVVLATVVIVNFVAASNYVFNTRGHQGRRFFFYLVSLVLLYFADVLTVRILTSTLGLHYLVSAFASRVCFFVIKYFYYQRILFNTDSFLYPEKADG
ncbi:MAG TPA: hypothetical protein ENN40_09055 [Candidatus Aminicenantes bacterium]|nr:hypothetical protein [Candidatus Aminicenantes bacterium]